MIENAKPGIRAALAARASSIRPGRKVRVTKGRKVAKGTEGWVIHVVESKFRKGDFSALIAEQGTAGRSPGIPEMLAPGASWKWTATTNLEVIAPEPVDEAEVDRLSIRNADCFRRIGSRSDLAFIG
jgi:hypothetical protein